MFTAIVIAMCLTIIGIIYICQESKFYKQLYYQSEKDIIVYNSGSISKEELVNNCVLRKTVFNPFSSIINKYKAYMEVYMKDYL